MTVAELIAALRNVPQEYPVNVWNEKTGYFEALTDVVETEDRVSLVNLDAPKSP